jgi:hypothetical protein
MGQHAPPQARFVRETLNGLLRRLEHGYFIVFIKNQLEPFSFKDAQY